jgi:hypothetical protein
MLQKPHYAKNTRFSRWKQVILHAKKLRIFPTQKQPEKVSPRHVSKAVAFVVHVSSRPRCFPPQRSETLSALIL